MAEVAAFSHDDSHKHDDQTDVMMDAIEHVFIRPHTGARTDMQALSEL